MPLILISPYLSLQPAYLFEFVSDSDVPMSLSMRAVKATGASMFEQSITQLGLKAAQSDSGGSFIQKQLNLGMKSVQAETTVSVVQKNITLGMRAVKPR